MRQWAMSKCGNEAAPAALARIASLRAPERARAGGGAPRAVREEDQCELSGSPRRTSRCPLRRRTLRPRARPGRGADRSRRRRRQSAGPDAARGPVSPAPRASPTFQASKWPAESSHSGPADPLGRRSRRPAACGASATRCARSSPAADTRSCARRRACSACRCRAASRWSTPPPSRRRSSRSGRTSSIAAGWPPASGCSSTAARAASARRLSSSRSRGARRGRHGGQRGESPRL